MRGLPRICEDIVQGLELQIRNSRSCTSKRFYSHARESVRTDGFPDCYARVGLRSGTYLPPALTHAFCIACSLASIVVRSEQHSLLGELFDVVTTAANEEAPATDVLHRLWWYRVNAPPAELPIPIRSGNGRYHRLGQTIPAAVIMPGVLCEPSPSCYMEQ